MRVEEIGRPSKRTAGDSITAKPRRAPTERRVPSPPERPRPKRKFPPWTTARTPSRPRSRRSTKSSAGVFAISAPKRRTTSSSTPAAASRASRSAGVEMAFGARSGRRTRAGWGSKVTAAKAAPRRAASRRATASVSRWPRCTPSKLPMAATEPFGRGAAAGGSGSLSAARRATLMAPPAAPSAPLNDRPARRPGRRRARGSPSASGRGRGTSSGSPPRSGGSGCAARGLPASR